VPGAVPAGEGLVTQAPDTVALAFGSVGDALATPQGVGEGLDLRPIGKRNTLPAGPPSLPGAPRRRTL